VSAAERRAGIDSRLAPAADEGAAVPSMRAGGEPAGRLDGERRYTDREIYRRVLREARPYWGHILGIFLLTLLATPLALLAPVPLAIIVDSVLGDKPLPGFLQGIVPASVEGSTTGLLVFAVLLVVGLELFSQLQSLSAKLLRSYTSERLTLRFRAKLFRHAQRLSMAYHDRKGSADANYRIQSDAAAVPSVAVSGVIPFVSAAVMFTMMMVIIARIELSLALIAVVVAPVIAALTWTYRRRLRTRHREVKVLESSALGVVQEVLTSLRVVKAFGQEEREEQRFTARAADGTRARLRVALVDGTFWVAIGLVTSIGTGLVLFVGVRSVQSGAVTLGSLLLVMGYLGKLYSPLYTVSGQVAALQSGFASSERAFSLLDEEHDVPERPDARPIGRARGAVEFRDVSFSYVANRPVLEHVSFSVEPGARVGVAGRTGSGKTTLVSLLTRFYDPTHGAVLLDGVDLRDYRVADLRDQFAIVLQDPVLFSTTIGENIAYGKADASADELVAAAVAADAHDFITALPLGYDTEVGERGMTLSGGERQRIALARAFLKDAPILILDEPTSSVDVKTEGTIIDAMERLMAGRTTIMIAHRLSTLDSCDVRMEVDAGRVLERSSDGLALPAVVPLEVTA
jgi:ATP-binding cassette, subfamily B, bacterial